MILHEFPIQKVPATISNHDPELLAFIAKTLIAKRENSHNFYLESLDNCLHYRYDFIYSVLLSGELGVFGVSHFWRKAGGGEPRISSPRWYHSCTSKSAVRDRNGSMEKAVLGLAE